MGQPVSQLPQTYPPPQGYDRNSSPRRSSDPPRTNPSLAGTQHHRMSLPPTSLPQVSEVPRSTLPPRGNNSSRGSSPPRGNDRAQRGSSLRRDDGVRSASPLRGNEVSQRTSSRRGSELSQGVSSLRQDTDLSQNASQRRSETAQRDSSPRGANLPQDTSSRRGSDFPQTSSQRQPSNFLRNVSSPRGSDVPSGALSRRESDALREGSGLSHSARESDSPQRRQLTDRNISPPGLLDYRSGRYFIQPGQFSMTSSRMLLAMQQGLNSQREELYQKHRTGSEMVPRPGKSQMENKLILSSSPQCDTPQPSSQYFTRPNTHPKDESTQTTDMKKEFLQAPKISTQPVTESRQHDSSQPAKKLIRKHVLNPKDACTQKEPVYRLSIVKSELPQKEVLTTAKASPQSEARESAKTSLPPTTTIKVSPQSETKLRSRPVFHPESESDYRCEFHEKMEVARKNSLLPGPLLPHRGSLSTDNELKISSLRKESDPGHRTSLLTGPELRKSSLQAGPPLLNQRGSIQKENWSACKPAFYPESESEYRCPLHLEMEDAYPHTLSLGSDISHRGSLSREIEMPLGISPGLKQECFRRPCLLSKNMSTQTELFSSGSPSMEIKQAVRPSLYLKTDLWAAPYTEVAFPPGTMPPRSLAKFGPQSPWWYLLQTDAHPPASQEISRKITSPLVLDWISEQNTSLPATERMWQKPSSPTTPEYRHSKLSSLPHKEIGHRFSNPPVLDMTGLMTTSPPQPLGERLDSSAESEIASDSSWMNIPISCQDLPKLEAPPEQKSTATDSWQGGQWPEHAGPSKTEDRIKSKQRKSIPRFNAFFVGML